MPYAKNRSQEPLNKAYAHIVAENFAEAAAGLKDRMVQNMGFERLELASVLLPADNQGSGGDGSKQAIKIPECLIQVSAAPDTKNWPEQIKQLVEVRMNSQGAVLVVNYQNSEELKQAQLFVTESVKARDKESVRSQFDDHHAIRQAIKSPALLGYEFSPIPQLCIELDGSLDLVEQETLSSLGSWSLSSSPPQLAGFNLNEDTKEFEIDISGQRVTWKMSTNHQIDLNSLESDVTENDLIRWLDQQVMDRYWGITQNDLQVYLKKLITHLIVDRGFTKTSLVRGKNPLSTAIRQEINRLRNLAIEKGFQSSLPKMQIAGQDEIKFFSFQYVNHSVVLKGLPI
jgi:type III restriction enzyme